MSHYIQHQSTKYIHKSIHAAETLFINNHYTALLVLSDSAKIILIQFDFSCTWIVFSIQYCILCVVDTCMQYTCMQCTVIITQYKNTGLSLVNWILSKVTQFCVKKSMLFFFISCEGTESNNFVKMNQFESQIGQHCYTLEI